VHVHVHVAITNVDMCPQKIEYGLIISRGSMVNDPTPHMAIIMSSMLAFYCMVSTHIIEHLIIPFLQQDGERSLTIVFQQSLPTTSQLLYTFGVVAGLPLPPLAGGGGVLGKGGKCWGNERLKLSHLCSYRREHCTPAQRMWRFPRRTFKM